MKRRHRRQHAPDISQRLHKSPLINHQHQSHHARHKNRTDQQGHHHFPTYKRAQRSSQLPIARAQAAQKNEGQQHQQSQSRAQQGSLQSAPSCGQRIQRNSNHKSRDRQPVRNTPAAPIRVTGNQRQRHRGNQHNELQSSSDSL